MPGDVYHWSSSGELHGHSDGSIESRMHKPRVAKLRQQAQSLERLSVELTRPTPNSQLFEGSATIAADENCIAEEDHKSYNSTQDMDQDSAGKYSVTGLI
jgi:hypothetical protein